MEEHSDIFKASNAQLILDSIRKSLKGKIGNFTEKLEKSDPKKHGKVPQNAFAAALGEYGVTLDEQQTITLFRKYSFADTDLFRYKDFLKDIS
jgi:hypothetical protein